MAVSADQVGLFTPDSYFSTILALFCGILDVAHNCGSVMTTAPAFAAVKRLIQLIAALYPPWPISCIHYERRKHSLQLILDAHDFVRKANDLLGIKMVAPPPGMPVSVSNSRACALLIQFCTQLFKCRNTRLDPCKRCRTRSRPRSLRELNAISAKS